jgi:hypothetical protein
MNALNDSLIDYLQIRRKLGFELERAGREPIPSLTLT